MCWWKGCIRYWRSRSPCFHALWAHKSHTIGRVAKARFVCTDFMEFLSSNYRTDILDIISLYLIMFQLWHIKIWIQTVKFKFTKFLRQKALRERCRYAQTRFWISARCPTSRGYITVAMKLIATIFGINTHKHFISDHAKFCQNGVKFTMPKFVLSKNGKNFFPRVYIIFISNL